MAVRFRPLAEARYRPALDNIGVQHGSDYDCQREGCTRCQPYREAERAYWDSLSEQEKAEVKWFRWSV